MVNFIDVSKKNCWIGQLLPGSSNNENKTLQINFKNECKDNTHYRIGWSIENEKYHDSKLSEIEIADFVKDFIRKKFFDKEKNQNKNNTDFEEEYNSDFKANDKKNIEADNDLKREKNSLNTALNSMNQMKKNDLIITRISGTYYIGEIKETAQYKKQELPDESSYRWSVEVEKWIPIEAKDMPGDIVGRFSQRRHPTIQRVGKDSLRFKLLLINFYVDNVLWYNIIIKFIYCYILWSGEDK